MNTMMTEMPMHYAGGGFPWGLLILAGIAYFLWTKGVFDGRGRFGNGGRWGGPGGGSGGPGGPGGGYGPGAGAGYGQSQMTQTPGYGQGAAAGPAGAADYGDPRAMFEAWHRQAHEAGVQHGHGGAPQAPAASAVPAAETAPGTDKPESGTAV